MYLIILLQFSILGFYESEACYSLIIVLLIIPVGLHYYQFYRHALENYVSFLFYITLYFFYLDTRNRDCFEHLR